MLYVATAPLSNDDAVTPRLWVSYPLLIGYLAFPMVTLEPCAKEQASVLQNLFQLYGHDFSEHMPLELGEDGRFLLPIGDVWWTDANHHPFLVRHEQHLAGFALVRRGSRVTSDKAPMDVAELFIARGGRRKKLGTAVMRTLVAKFPGPWEARVRLSNASAASFWAEAMSSLRGARVSGEPFTASGAPWQVFRL